MGRKKSMGDIRQDGVSLRVQLGLFAQTSPVVLQRTVDHGLRPLIVLGVGRCCVEGC